MTGNEIVAADAQSFFIDPDVMGVVDQLDVFAPTGADEIDITLLLDGLLGPVVESIDGEKTLEGTAIPFDGGPVAVLPPLTIVIDEPAQQDITYF